MNAKQIEVHDYYKSLHPKALIFYHFREQYIVLGEDVQIALKMFPTMKVSESGEGYVPDDIHILSVFGKSGKEVCIIDYTNDKGTFDLPDIELLKSEKEMDY